jgi:hypothetical protein
MGERGASRSRGAVWCVWFEAGRRRGCLTSVPCPHPRPTGGGERQGRPQARACSRYLRPKGFSDEREMNKGSEHDVELIVAGEYPAKALKAPEEGFNLIPTAVQRLVKAPRVAASRPGRHDGFEPEVQRQPACFVALVRAVHDQGNRGLGGGGNCRRSSRPAGASWCCPGERENVTARRASAATR